jgi:hypothetical protein
VIAMDSEFEACAPRRPCYASGAANFVQSESEIGLGQPAPRTVAPARDLRSETLRTDERIVLALKTRHPCPPSTDGGPEFWFYDLEWLIRGLSRDLVSRSVC